MQSLNPLNSATRFGLGMIALLAFQLTGCGGSDGGGAPATSGGTLSQMGGALQGIPLALTPTVSIFAGAPVWADGTGAAARFSMPYSVTSDGTDLYVADTINNKIRKIVISTGVVTTLAGSGAFGAADGAGTAARFNGPVGITSDGTNLYVTDVANYKIRKIVIATGVVSSFTGVANTASLAGAADGAGATATFGQPYGITTDGTNLYVADTGNNKIRKIVIASGVVSSLTGAADTPSVAGAADGAGTAATFSAPFDITTDGANLYVTDAYNNKIRKIVISTGVVSSFTGTTDTAGAAGAADGAGTAATFNFPYGITSDGTNLYVADEGNNKIRKIVIASGVVSSLTGVADTAGALGADDGAGTTATFFGPHDITALNGKLYVADTNNGTIRTIVLSTAAVTTLAGNAGADGTGASAGLDKPYGITSDGTNLYVTDSGNNKIRKIVIATGVVTTLAGSGAWGAADGAGAAATFNNPGGITTDGTNLYVAETGNHKIRKIVIATGVVSSLTGVANTAGAMGATDGAATIASFNTPTGITTDGTNLYVTDSGNNKIRKIVIATGKVSSLTGTANTPGVPGHADGDGAGLTSAFNGPAGITTDGTNLYVADMYNHDIRQIVIATGAVITLAGSEAMGAADAGTTVTFHYPGGITTDGTNLYVTDSGNNKIRRIVIATGAVTSLTGVANTSGAAGAADGAGAAATFNNPYGITTDGTNLYVADTYSSTIRKIQ